MADYKELLRRAVEALPENNGAARRAVYEKARAALVGQLRAINPPLPARDITTHRLQLEDCIRQVEQEASEANIAGLGAESPAPSLPPVFAAEAKAKPAPKAPSAEVAKPKGEPQKAAKATGKANGALNGAANGSASIEDIIAAAEKDRGGEPEEAPAKAAEPKARPPKSQPVLVAKSDVPPKDQAKPEPKRPAASKSDRPLPSIVARAEAAKGRPAPQINAEPARRGPSSDPRRGGDSRIAATARQMEPIAFDVPEDVAAMAAIREVEVEQQPQAADPQGAIDRAIATLDREARGDARPAQFADTEVELDADEPMQAPPKKNGFFNGRSADTPAPKVEQREFKTPRPAKEFATPRRQSSRSFSDNGIPRAQAERGGLGADTIFLIIFVALLVGAGGVGFWAWQEGFINLDAMFGKGTPAVATAATTQPVVTPDSTGPGNTETPVATAEPANQLKADQQRLPTVATAAPPAPPSAETVAPLAL